MPPSEPTDATLWEDDDGVEYELEPPDEAVLRGAEARARDDLERAQHAIDVDAVYRELEGRSEEDLSWEPGDFRFSTKHLLIATTAIAVLLGAWKAAVLTPHSFAALVAVALLVLGSAHAYIAWRERRRQEALLARQRYERAAAHAEGGFGDAPEGAEPTLGSAWEELRSAAGGTLRFGLRELGLLMLFVAVLMVPLRYLGAGPTAALVGLAVLGGLGLQAADFDLPRWALGVWWLLILAYCLLTLGQAAAAGLGYG